MKYPWKCRARQGAAVVELAAVAIIFFMVLFGIMEYCRFIFLHQVIDSAAREGMRYAVVNTQNSTLKDDTIKVVQQRLGNQTPGASIRVYAADSTGKQIGEANEAQFGQYIAVQIDWNYVPILPSFLFLNNNLPISVRSLGNSEAN